MEDFKHFIDGISLAATLGVLAGWLPHIAAAMSIVWTMLRIYESKTVQGWMNKDER